MERVVRGVSLFFSFFAAFGLVAADLRLSVSSLDTNRRPTLLLSGLESGSYGLQASTNLTQWFDLFTATGTNGELRYFHADAARFDTLFYRGSKLPDNALAKIVPQVDSNYTAVGVITLAEGGRLTLTNDGGTRYTFTVAPSNVLESVAITMQLVTNFASFPFENEMRSAVIFKPDGFEFHGAGVLEIQYPTNVPHLKISSFAFNNAGEEFHLVPDLVSSNSVRIPVTHFSGVGGGVWQPTARTRAITTHIDNTRNAFAHRLATSFAEERQRQLLGSEGQDSKVMAELISTMDDYYEHYLKPYFGEAEKDCALAQHLTREILVVERQRQLLGAGADTSGFIGSATSDKWMCNCLSEALKACEEGKISDQSLVRRVFGIERQSQLLGRSDVLKQCGLGSHDEFFQKALDQKLPCVKEWIGSVEYKDGGTRTWDCKLKDPPSPDEISCTASTTTALSFAADVDQVELKDESFLPFFSKQTWRLKFFADADGSFSHDSTGLQKLPCGAMKTTTSQDAGASSATLQFDFVFTFEDGILTEFFTDNSSFFKVDSFYTVRSSTGSCGKGDPGSSSANAFPSFQFLGIEPFEMQEIKFTKQSPTELEGTVTGTNFGVDGLPLDYSWKFSLQRRKQ